MEGALPPAPKPSRRRRVLLVLVVTAVLVAAGVVVWWEFIRPRTIAEVFAFDHFQPGSAVTVAGTITGIYRENTSYGPKVLLALDHYSECNTTGQVFGDPNATYAAGEAFQTTLHFQSYSIDGDPAVFAPELACPFPAGFMALTNELDAISAFRGILLVYNASEAGGWQDYRVFTQNGNAYNLSALSVTLEKTSQVVGNTPRFPPGSALDSAATWDVLVNIVYYGAVGGGPSLYFPLIDRMSSLQAGTSLNGSLRFIDVNGDRMLDNGDRLDIRLPPTSSSTSWDTYLLQIGVPFGSNLTYVGLDRIMLNGPAGPLDPLLPSERPRVDLAYAGTQQGPPLQSTVRVTAVRIGSPLPLSSLRYLLTDWSGVGQFSGNLTSLPTTTASGLTLALTDSNHDGLLDAGDLFTVTGVANRTDLSLSILDSKGGIGELDWIVGFGPTVGSLPYTTFTVQGTGPWTVKANVPSWSPELAFNRTVRATLFENGRAILTNVTLGDGTLGTFANGTLNFTDADGDGHLSTGDYFTLRGSPTAWYQIQVTVFFGVWRFPSPSINGP